MSKSKSEFYASIEDAEANTKRHIEEGDMALTIGLPIDPSKYEMMMNIVGEEMAKKAIEVDLVTYADHLNAAISAIKASEGIKEHFIKEEAIVDAASFEGGIEFAMLVLAKNGEAVLDDMKGNVSHAIATIQNKSGDDKDNTRH